MPQSSHRPAVVSHRPRRLGSIAACIPAGVRRRALVALGVIAASGSALTVFGSAALASGSTTNPCALITKGQIQAITHHTVVKRTLAPLGPTCIYELRHATEITLLIERTNFARAAGEMRNRTHVSVHARSAYCGRVGEPTLYVSLPAGKILAVTAGCSVARRIATIAVGVLLR